MHASFLPSFSLQRQAVQGAGLPVQALFSRLSHHGMPGAPLRPPGPPCTAVANLAAGEDPSMPTAWLSMEKWYMMEDFSRQMHKHGDITPTTLPGVGSTGWHAGKAEIV